MARVKFLVFALAALGLWTAHLFLLSPALSARAVEGAAREAAGAGVAMALKIDERRIEVQKAALRLVGNGAILNALRSSRPEAPTAEKFAAVRAAVSEAMAESLRDEAVIGWVNEAGGLYARGSGEPVDTKEALDLQAVAGAGGDGVALSAFGQGHVFYSVPFAVPSVDGKGEPRVLGRIVLGAPLLPEGLADAVARERGLESLAVASGGKIVASAGPDRAAAERAEKDVKPGETKVVGRGEVRALGPVRFPLLTAGDALGGAAPLQVGSRQAIVGTPYEVVAVATVKPFMQSLADYQELAVHALAGLVGFTLIWLLVMGSGKSAPVEAPPAVPEKVAVQKAEAAPPSRKEAKPELPPAPEPAPDDFPFGAPPRPSGEHALPPLAAEGPPENPFEGLSAPPTDAPSPFDELPPPPYQPGPDAPTVAYETAAPGADPFALAAAASAPMPPLEQRGAVDYNPDATRVATVPEELLRASQRTTGEVTAVNMRAAAAHAPFPAAELPRVQPVVPPVGGDEQHFQEVYRDFVATRERCGEPADGLTYDKFVHKLRKNRDQLIQKYNCRSVRFSVYVKDGKAALKATPLKD